jgi:hypothetical protein
MQPTLIKAATLQVKATGILGSGIGELDELTEELRVVSNPVYKATFSIQMEGVGKRD